MRALFGSTTNYDDRSNHDNHSNRDNRSHHDNHSNSNNNSNNNTNSNNPTTNNYYGGGGIPPAAAIPPIPFVSHVPAAPYHANQAIHPLGQADHRGHPGQAGPSQSNVVNGGGYLSNISGIPPLEPKIEGIKKELIKTEDADPVLSIAPIQIPNNSNNNNSNNNNNNNNNNNKEKKEVVNLISPDSNSGDSSNASTKSSSSQSMNGNTEITFGKWSKAFERMKGLKKQNEENETKRKANENAARRLSASLESCTYITMNNNNNKSKEKGHKRNLSDDSQASSSSSWNSSDSTDDGDESMDMNHKNGKKSEKNMGSKNGKNSKSSKDNKESKTSEASESGKSGKSGKSRESGESRKVGKARKAGKASKSKEYNGMSYSEAIDKSLKLSMDLISSRMDDDMKFKIRSLKDYNDDLKKRDSSFCPQYGFVIYIENPSQDKREQLDAVIESIGWRKHVDEMSPNFYYFDGKYNPCYDNYENIIEICNLVRQCDGIKLVFLINFHFKDKEEATKWCYNNLQVFRKDVQHSIRVSGWSNTYSNSGLRYLISLYETKYDKHDFIRFENAYQNGNDCIDIYFESSTTSFKNFVLLNRFVTDSENMSSLVVQSKTFGLQQRTRN